MKKLDVIQATDSPGHYARGLAPEPLVSTEGGHVITALPPIDGADLESITLSMSPKFQAVIEQSREEYRNGASLSADDVRRELGVE